MYKFLPILLFAYGFAITTEDIYDNSYALIIGINEYQNVQPLNYAVNDAFSIANLLINSFDFPENNISLLMNENATQSNIKDAIFEISNKANDNDRVLIYFAGHGETMDYPDGSELGYLIPVDGNPDNLFASGLSMQEFKQISEITSAKHVLYLVDACYGGTMVDLSSFGFLTIPSDEPFGALIKIDDILIDKKTPLISEKLNYGYHTITISKKGYKDYSKRVFITPNLTETIIPIMNLIEGIDQNIISDLFDTTSVQAIDVNSTPNYIEIITQNKSRQIITAGGRGEQVIEKSEWGHSAFTKNLNRGLMNSDADANSDGYITAQELAMFLRYNVSIDSESEQTPSYGRYTSGEGEFVFIKNNKDKADFIDVRNKYFMNQVSIQIEDLLYYELKGKLYDVISSSLDSVMQTSNHNSILSNLNKEQLITLLELSNEQKKNLSNNTKEKELINEKGDFYDNSLAVIIGINEYTKSKRLKYAVNDAKAIKELLVNKFGFKNENIRLLLDAEATYSSIRRELFAVSKLAKANDRILVYFAGHGQTITTNSDMKIGYLIPVNGNIEEPTLTGIPMDDIFRICQSDSKHMLFLMDACYSGLMAEASRGIEISKDKKDYISTVANLSARQIITAGSGEEEALEGDEWQHSAFTLNLIKALDNWEADGYDEDGYITASELGEYLKKAVFDETDGRQTPQVARIKRSKGGEFVFSKFK